MCATKDSLMSTSCEFIKWNVQSLSGMVPHLGARNSRKAFHQNIGHFHYFLSEMYNSKY
jgi:hypothetical protein